MDPFTADYLANLTAELSAPIIAKVARRFQQTWQGDESEQAIKRCLHAAILSIVAHASLDEPEKESLLADIFTDFFDNRNVAGEVMRLVRGKPMDVDELAFLFQEAGYDAQTLPGLRFPEAVAAFEAAFLEAAATEPVLQPIIRIRQAREQIKLTQEQIEWGRQMVDALKQRPGQKIAIQAGNIVATNVVSGRQDIGTQIIFQWGGQPTVDASALAVYLKWLMRDRQSMPLRGIMTSGSERPPELAHVYVALNTTTTIDKEHKQGGRLNEEQKPLSALAAVAANRQMVLLGDPGSGKSTFASHLAYCLAAHQVYPNDNWLDKLPDWPAGEAAAIPLLVILRDFSRWLPDPLPQKATAAHLQDFIEQTLQAQKLDKAWPALEAALEAGDAILLLDGLDEVTTTGHRCFVRDAVWAFAQRYDKCRLLVTCRVLSYQYDPDKAVEDLRLPLKEYPLFTLDEFTPAQRQNFINAWYKELKRQGHLVGHDETRLIGDLQRAIEREDLEEMAGNPLLLTMMAVVHKDGKLPDSRVKLYDEVIKLLLLKWDEVKSEDGSSRLRRLLRQAKRDDTDLKRALSAVAYKVHTGGGSREGTADIDEAFLWRMLGELKKKEVDGNYEPDIGWGQELLDVIKKRAGLLIERSTNGPFAFPHRTIQEYLAGAHLASLEAGASPPSDSGQSECASFVECGLHWARRDVAWWKMILFAVEHRVSVNPRQPHETLALVGKLCPPSGPETSAGWRLVWLAGDLLLSLGEQAKDSEWGPELSQRVRQRLAALLDGGYLSAPERAKAGMVLAQLGDTRPGVGVVERDGLKLPHILWGNEVPAGTYTIGGDKDAFGSFDEQPVEIKQSFHLSRYPITNAQFQCFVDAPDWDNLNWWQGIPDNEKKFSPPAFAYANHPRERVSWYQAMAFCQWLTAKLHTGKLAAAPLTGHLKQYKITLPHEYEWEVAARWPNEDAQERIYPWGAEFDKEKANTIEGGIGQTTAVGLYPSGKNTALELYDLSGNVWQWCRNKYDNPDKYKNPEDDAVDDSYARRVVRGGSWSSSHDNARAAARDHGGPGYRNGNGGFRLVVGVVRRSPSHHDH